MSCCRSGWQNRNSRKYRWTGWPLTYDGHFVVQDVSGHWGMVTPEGEAVTRFLLREERDEINGDILHQVIEQFKRAQNRRFIGWMREAVCAEHLGMMANKLRSSFAHYDYGALYYGEIQVRLARDTLPASGSSGSEEMLNTPLPAGTAFAWRPAQRNYFGNIDLRTHSAIGLRSPGHEGGYHGIRVPWDAQVLDLPPLEFGSDVEQRQFEGLTGAEHLSAANRLIETLATLTDLIDAESTSAFSPELKAATTLHMLLIRLARLMVLNEPRSFRELLLNRLQLDLLEIDFPNLLAAQPATPVQNSPQEDKMGDKPWVKHPKQQTAWSMETRSAYEIALVAYQAWEPQFQNLLELGSYERASLCR